MKIKLVGFRGSRRGVYNDYGILEVENENPVDLIGEKVVWTTPTGKTIIGKILRQHGSRNLLAKFRKGLPGNALGDELKLSKLSKAKEKIEKAPEKPLKVKKSKVKEEKAPKPKKEEKAKKKKTAPKKGKKSKETAKKKPASKKKSTSKKK